MTTPDTTVQPLGRHIANKVMLRGLQVTSSVRGRRWSICRCRLATSDSVSPCRSGCPTSLPGSLTWQWPRSSCSVATSRTEYCKQDWIPRTDCTSVQCAAVCTVRQYRRWSRCDDAADRDALKVTWPRTWRPSFDSDHRHWATSLTDYCRHYIINTSLAAQALSMKTIDFRPPNSTYINWSPKILSQVTTSATATQYQIYE